MACSWCAASPPNYRVTGHFASLALAPELARLREQAGWRQAAADAASICFVFEIGGSRQLRAVHRRALVYNKLTGMQASGASRRGGGRSAANAHTRPPARPHPGV